MKKKQNTKIFYVERIIKFTSDWYVVIYQAVLTIIVKKFYTEKIDR